MMEFQIDEGGTGDLSVVGGTGARWGEIKRTLSSQKSTIVGAFIAAKTGRPNWDKGEGKH